MYITYMHIGIESCGVLCQWAESNLERDPNSTAPNVSNTGSCYHLTLDVNTKQNNIITDGDPPMQNTAHLHNNVASTFNDTLNFHLVRACLEVIETHNAPKVKLIKWK